MAARSDRALRSACELVGAQAREMVGRESGLGKQGRAHAIVLLDDVLGALDSPTTSRPVEFHEVMNRRSRDVQPLLELTREMMHSVGAMTLVNIGTTRAAALTAKLGDGLPMSVQTRDGDVRLADHLRATLVELVVLAMGTPALQPAALRDVARSLATALAARHPGQTIEVRVPPATAVQLGSMASGPTHTRGTPPNVVETDERTWVRLATGLMSLDHAISDGLVTSSGSHADELAQMLPVVDLAPLG